MPFKWNLPNVILSAALGRSPCSTWISTAGWLSAAVEKTSVFFVGIVVFRSINLVNTPPNVSTPNDRGVTSSSSKSLTSPVNTPPWIAAPIATHSIGSILRSGALPNKSSNFFSITGILVGPPTKIVLLISPLAIPASCNAFKIGASSLFKTGSINCSNLALVRVKIRCLGPPLVAVI